MLARPGAPTGEVAPGLHPLGIGSGRDGVLYVPGSYRAECPAPLVLMLHGAGGHGGNALGILRPLADAHGLVLVAPDSRASTWDVIVNRYGPDVAFIDRALAETFARVAVDPARLAVGGFSDGASYALSLGVMNGDLFTHVLAFSPGFLAALSQSGAPRIYVSHGVHDRVLPIDPCSRKLVPMLQRAGYEVRYREFDGPHTVPPEVTREAVEWLTS
ncbi:MAG: phospholipase [Gemmatimonadota bacterium]|nr:phospholipase [Gemmatimonadota bacterium]